MIVKQLKKYCIISKQSIGLKLYFGLNFFAIINEIARIEEIAHLSSQKCWNYFCHVLCSRKKSHCTCPYSTFAKPFCIRKLVMTFNLLAYGKTIGCFYDYIQQCILNLSIFKSHTNFED